MSSSIIRPGTVLANRYRIEGNFPPTNMSVVYRAIDQNTGEVVALKVLKALDYFSRFQKEARLSYGLQHRNIVSVIDYKTLKPETSSSGEPIYFMVMKWIPGKSLRVWMTHDFDPLNERDSLGRETLPLKPPTPQMLHFTLKVLMPIADALDYLHHEKGLIHRDIKPGNILFDGVMPVLIDLGIAKELKPSKENFDPERTGIQGRNQEPLTRLDERVGTDRYMSPEQFKAPEEVDGRTDQYALALLVYELLANGHSPFDDARGSNTRSTKLVDSAKARAWEKMHIEAVPTPLTAYRSDLPPAIWEVLERGLSKRPSDRYGSVREFAEAFKTAATPEERISFVPDRSRQTAMRLLLGGIGVVSVLLAFVVVLNLINGAGAVNPGTEVSITEAPLDANTENNPGILAVSLDNAISTQTPSRTPPNTATPTATNSHTPIPTLSNRQLTATRNAIVGGTATALYFATATVNADLTVIAVELTNIALSWTPTPTDTSTATFTPTSTPTFTSSPTPTPSATPTDTPTATFTPTNTPTFTSSPTPTLTFTPTNTPTFTPSPTLTPSATPTATPTLLAGGSRLLLMYNDSAGGNDIYIYDLVTQAEPINLTNSLGVNDQDPNWSPDGRRIVFVSNVDADGQPSDALWLWVINANGTGRVFLPNTPPLAGRPMWSPDGGKIAFHAPDQNGRRQIFVYEISTASTTQLTTEGENRRPVWNADGEQIVFFSNRECRVGDCRSADGDTELYIMNADGSRQRPLTDNNNPDERPFVSPDGSRIVWHRAIQQDDGSFRGDLYMMNIDGTGEAALVQTESSSEDLPVWSPDGQWVAFVRENASWVTRRQAFMINVNDGRLIDLQLSQEGLFTYDWN